MASQVMSASIAIMWLETIGHSEKLQVGKERSTKYLVGHGVEECGHGLTVAFGAHVGHRQSGCSVLTQGWWNAGPSMPRKIL